MKISIVDETTAGVRSEGRIIEIFEPKITVRTLIESRILHELDSEKERRLQVRPDQHPLNVASAPKSTKPDEHFVRAFKAFEAGQLIVLLPGGQAETLDQTLTLDEDDEVTFLRLVPLVGG